MKKTLSTFALGLALTFGAAAFAPAASAATTPAPAKPSNATTQPAAATPTTKAQFSAASAKLKAGRQVAISSYYAAVAAEQAADQAQLAAYEKRLAPIKVQLDAKYAAMDKAIATAENDYKLVAASFKTKYPAKAKTIAAEQAGLESRQAAGLKASRKLDENWRALQDSFGQRYGAAQREYDKAAASNKAAAKTALDAARAKLDVEMRNAISASEKKRMALDVAQYKDRQATALRIATVDKDFTAAGAKKDAKIAALRDGYFKDAEAIDAKFTAADPRNDFYTRFWASKDRIQNLTFDFYTAQYKYDADLAKLQTGYAAAKA